MRNLITRDNQDLPGNVGAQRMNREGVLRAHSAVVTPLNEPTLQMQDSQLKESPVAKMQNTSLASSMMASLRRKPTNKTDSS